MWDSIFTADAVPAPENWTFQSQIHGFSRPTDADDDDDDDDVQCYQRSETVGALLPWRPFHLLGKIFMRKKNTFRGIPLTDFSIQTKSVPELIDSCRDCIRGPGIARIVTDFHTCIS